MMMTTRDAGLSINKEEKMQRCHYVMVTCAGGPDGQQWVKSKQILTKRRKRNTIIETFL